MSLASDAQVVIREAPIQRSRGVMTIAHVRSTFPWSVLSSRQQQVDPDGCALVLCRDGVCVRDCPHTFGEALTPTLRAMCCSIMC